jgi:hypothetical protein
VVDPLLSATSLRFEESLPGDFFDQKIDFQLGTNGDDGNGVARALEVRW